MTVLRDGTVLISGGRLRDAASCENNAAKNGPLDRISSLDAGTGRITSLPALPTPDYEPSLAEHADGRLLYVNAAGADLLGA